MKKGKCVNIRLLNVTGALNTRNPRVICSTLKIIQLIATCSKESGRAFLPYYKSLLPILNLFKSVNRKI
jgi:hypothetical protein